MTKTYTDPKRLSLGDKLRLERDSLAVEGVVSKFENGNLVWLAGFDHAFNVVESGKNLWTPYLIGRPEPEPFSVIRWPERFDRVAYVRGEAGSWNRVPSTFDTTNHDYSKEIKMSIEQVVDIHGWDWDLVSVARKSPGLETDS